MIKYYITLAVAGICNAMGILIGMFCRFLTNNGINIPEVVTMQNVSKACFLVFIIMLVITNIMLIVDHKKK